LIETSNLYHCRLDQFNDPFEGAVKRTSTLSAAMLERSNLALARKNRNRGCSNRSGFAVMQLAGTVRSTNQIHNGKSTLPAAAGMAIVSTMERLEQSVDLSPQTAAILRPVDYVNFEPSVVSSTKSQG
jgi:hypothetical protein